MIWVKSEIIHHLKISNEEVATIQSLFNDFKEIYKQHGRSIPSDYTEVMDNFPREEKIQ